MQGRGWRSKPAERTCCRRESEPLCVALPPLYGPPWSRLVRKRLSWHPTVKGQKVVGAAARTLSPRMRRLAQRRPEANPAAVQDSLSSTRPHPPTRLIHQNQVQTCLSDCRTAAEAKMPSDAKEVPQEIQAGLEQCANQCQSTFMKRIPEFFQRINGYLAEADKASA